MHMSAAASEARRGHKIPGAGAMGWFQPHHLDLNFGPLEKSMHSQLLNSSPALIFIHFLNNNLVKEKNCSKMKSIKFCMMIERRIPGVKVEILTS